MNDQELILVVDDNESNLHMMNELLTLFGYKVNLARNAQEAFEIISDTPPQLILLDIMMPDMNGFEVAKNLKESENTKNIPIIMVTALHDVESKVKALEVGVDDFLSKPVDQTELRARIKSLLKVKAYYDYMQDHQKKLEMCLMSECSTWPWGRVRIETSVSFANLFKNRSTWPWGRVRIETICMEFIK